MIDKKPVPPALAQFAPEQLAEAGEQTATNRAEELITQLEAEIVKRDARIAELEAHALRLGQGSAERYWEGRWRDADAQLGDLVAHIERQDDAYALLSLDAGRKMEELEQKSEYARKNYARVTQRLVELTDKESEQAQEIERLNSYKRFESLYAESERELAALKAQQPSGVVDERDDFETWRVDNFCGGIERMKKCSNAPDVYYYTAEQEAWRAWKARAELATIKAGKGGAWKCSGCDATSGSSCNANGCFENERGAPPATSATPGWRCYHCDEHFTDADSAGLHFGTHQHQKPACLIDVAEYRAMEARMHAYNEEDAEIHRAMARMHGEHRTALQREEEKGYARALKDTGYDASADAVSVPVELLERALTYVDGDSFTAEELRALLAQSESDGVKS